MKLGAILGDAEKEKLQHAAEQTESARRKAAQLAREIKNNRRRNAGRTIRYKNR